MMKMKAVTMIYVSIQGNYVSFAMKKILMFIFMFSQITSPIIALVRMLEHKGEWEMEGEVKDLLMVDKEGMEEDLHPKERS